jgi:hypothetical protein
MNGSGLKESLFQRFRHGYEAILSLSSLSTFIFDYDCIFKHDLYRGI